MDRNGKKVLMLIVYLAAIILGIYMTFFNNNERSGQEVLTIESMEVNYIEEQLPAEENIAEGENYSNEGMVNNSLYFSNTWQLDGGNLPLDVQAVLVADTQRFLAENGYGDVSELYISDEDYEEDSAKISFLCFMDGYGEVLQIRYWIEERQLEYEILPGENEMGEKYE